MRRSSNEKSSSATATAGGKRVYQYTKKRASRPKCPVAGKRIQGAAAMVTSPTDPIQIDHLSNLPDALLLTILSLLPTRTAARTSVLSRRFRHLWEASPSVDLIFQENKNFIDMVGRALVWRDPSHTLLSLHIDFSCAKIYQTTSFCGFLSFLLVKALSLGLRHLTIIIGEHDSYFVIVPILPDIFSINSLQSLSLPTIKPLTSKESIFRHRTTLTRLKSLSLSLSIVNPAELNQLLSELCSLEDLHLEMDDVEAFRLSSQTIRKLKLIIRSNYQETSIVGLSIPSLELLHLETHVPLRSVPRIQGELPLLRKSVITLKDIREKDVGAVVGLLNCISFAEELSLDIKESWYEDYPFPILLEPDKDALHFPNLKHLDVSACFHKHNFEAVVKMLHHAPALESMKLVHQTPEPSSFAAKKRKRKDWASKLPRNADRNYRYAYFIDLHLSENSKEFVKWLNEKCPNRLKAHH